MMRSIESPSTRKTENTLPQSNRPGRSLDLLGRLAARYEEWRPAHMVRTGSPVSDRSGLLVLATILVVGFGSVLMLAGTTSHRATSEKSLQTHLHGRKVKDTDEPRPGGPALNAVEMVLERSLRQPRGRRLVDEAWTDLGSRAQVLVPRLGREDLELYRTSAQPRLLSPEQLALLQGLQNPVMRTPMMRTWKKLTVESVVALALAGGPALADSIPQEPARFMLASATAIGPAHADAPAAKEPVSKEQLDDVQKKLDKKIDDKASVVNQSVNDLGKGLGKKIEEATANINGVLEVIKAEQANLRQTVIKNNDLTQLDIESLRKEITSLKADVESLRNRLQTSTTRASLYNAEQAALAQSSGRVEMVNTYGSDMTIVVNGKAYVVRSGETKFSEPVGPGTFTYEVLGVQPPVAKTMSSNQIFVVRVHPR